MTMSSSALREVEEAFRRYEAEVEESNMTPESKKTYLLHSRNFIRWLRGDFRPGDRLAGSGRVRRRL